MRSRRALLLFLFAALLAARLTGAEPSGIYLQEAENRAEGEAASRVFAGLQESASRAAAGLLLFPLTEQQESSEISIQPILEDVLQEYHQEQGIFALIAGISLEVLWDDHSEILEIHASGSAPRLDHAIENTLESFERIFGIRFSSLLREHGISHVFSDHNSYLTIFSPEVETGDMFRLQDPLSLDDVGLLTAFRTYATTPDTAEVLVNYSTAKISPGTGLVPIDTALTIVLQEQQSLYFSGCSLSLITGDLSDVIRYAPELQFIYSWDTDRETNDLTFVEPGGYLLTSHGFSSRFEPGRRYTGRSSGSRFFLDVSADLGLGYFFASGGESSGWILSGSSELGIGMYLSSRLDLSIHGGFSRIVLLEKDELLMHSCYIAPGVTFRL